MAKKLVVGVSGTREGGTPAQKDYFTWYLESIKPNQLDHGCCDGIDSEIHWACLGLSPKTRIMVHPPVDQKLMDVSIVHNPPPNVRILPAREYLWRNRNIVDASTVLLAFPKEMSEQKSGGTWYTIRYATGRIPVRIIYPDGSEEMRDV